MAGLAACVIGLSACAYTRHKTPLSNVGNHAETEGQAPDNLWKLVVVSAEIPRETRSGSRWDDDDTPPDPYLKLMVGGKEIWETKTLDDQDHPQFNASPPKNLSIDRNARVRLELWDDDGSDAFREAHARVQQGPYLE